MACCKCCCGGVNCTEGQQGKCCCGGPTGACCSPGQYCCSGVCQAEPCDPCYGPCDEENPCPEGCYCCDGACQGEPCQSQCDCFADGWPASFTANICGLEDYFLSGNGRCNCPADGYAAGLNQSVVLDYEGEITEAACGATRPFWTGSVVLAGIAAAAVYRGTMQNSPCDEYGVELIVWKDGSQCMAELVIGRVVSGAALCDAWTSVLQCNEWAFSGSLSTACDETGFGGSYGGVEIQNFGSYYGGIDLFASCTLTAN